MISATQHVRKMRGGAQSHLMLCSDDCAYIVKFQNNPQHLRVLANEFLGTGLAQAVGLTVPHIDVVDVAQWLISSTTELAIERGSSVVPFMPGFQFGSQLAGGLLPGGRFDYLPASELMHVVNRAEFAGMLAIDKWTSNSDARQAVFHKRLRQKHYMATFIDQGCCFDLGSWTFCDAPLRGVYARAEVYREVTGWESFEPWLSRIETMDPQLAWNIARLIPEDWLGGPPIEIEILIERLFARRQRIRDLIGEFRDSTRNPFPLWKQVFVPGMSRCTGQVLSFRSS